MGINFQKLISRKQAVLTDDIMLLAWIDTERIKFCTGLQEHVSDLELVDRDYYFDENWLEEVTNRYLNTPPYELREFITRGIQYGEKLLEFAKSIPTALDKDKITALFHESVEHLKNLSVFLPLTHPLAKAVENRVTELLIHKGVSSESLPATLLALSRPTKLNGPRLEEMALLDIKLRSETDPAFNVEAALQSHAEEFGYLGYREPFSTGYSLDFFRERLASLVPSFQSGEEKRITLTSEGQELIALLQDFVFFRNYRTEKLYQSLFLLERLWKNLALTYKLTHETDLATYRLQECSDLFTFHQKLSDTEVTHRSIGHGFLLHDDDIEFISGDELISKKASLASYAEAKQSLKGMPACPGVAEGTVKVVSSSKDQDKVLVGDILVASMTTPDFLPAMRRAAAFITDEGGVTCHAAIVARELGKPCIIGTRNATKILKDGDKVTVNADAGLAEIR